MPNALIYVRKSTPDRRNPDRSRSTVEQEADCRRWCDEMGIHVLEVIVDDGISASRYGKKERTGWQRVLDLIGNGTADTLVTWETSRATRQLGEFAALRDLLRANGAQWIASGKVADLGLTGAVHAVIDEHSAEEGRARIHRAMRANAEKGRPHGPNVYGYRRVYDPHTRALIRTELDPEQAPVVREIVRRVLAGETARSIAADLNDRGLTRPRGDWDLTQIRRVCVNPTYNGKRTHKGEVIGDADWPKLIDDDTFSRLAAVFNDPVRQKLRRGDRVNLLAGVARCGVCGGPMRYARQGGFIDKKGRHRTVRETYMCHGGKFCVARDLNNLEHYVTTVVIERLSRPDVRQLFADDTLDPEVDAAMAEVDQLRQRLADAVDQFTSGALTAGTLARIEADLLPRITSAERRARVAGLPTAAADIANDADPVAAWEALPRTQQREVIRALMTPVVLPVKVRGRKAFDPSTVRIDWHR
jgi:site-specific DNA recombinase